ncbi:class I SAM-dependent methyltransferase [Gorillibacterium sp. CAU 1737]|uniref:class I SAM-dependent methyltransferase n=1 Tax=Gorillibacterium sp. CAU 1737 TaxID=3140362 RepID=UPI0032606843
MNPWNKEEKLEHPQDEERIGAYWERRFVAEGLIWSDVPSQTAQDASHWFQQEGLRTLLVPGAGYGRNTRFFSSSYKVDAIELSPSAAKLGEAFDPKTTFYVGSAFDPIIGGRDRYDAIYCYDLLHLFREADRKRLLQSLIGRLRGGGILYLTVFSNEDPHCGKGDLLEPGTYLYKPDKFAHFYEQEELLRLVPGWNVLETRSWREPFPPEDGRQREYTIRSLAARKPSGEFQLPAAGQ